MKVAWIPDNEYSQIFKFAEWHERPVVSRNFWRGVGWAALFSLPFWIIAFVAIAKKF